MAPRPPTGTFRLIGPLRRDEMFRRGIGGEPGERGHHSRIARGAHLSFGAVTWIDAEEQYPGWGIPRAHETELRRSVIGLQLRGTVLWQIGIADAEERRPAELDDPAGGSVAKREPHRPGLVTVFLFMTKPPVPEDRILPQDSLSNRYCLTGARQTHAQYVRRTWIGCAVIVPW